jgi:cellulose 1,4-beta-cellobiosidase
LVNLKLFKDNGRDGSRIYLLDAQDRYQVFFLLNKELSFDVDVSRSSCGVASGIYFSAMKPDGGKSSTNQAGSKYGTGYCDAQGPRDMHFVEGRVGYLSHRF